MSSTIRSDVDQVYRKHLDLPQHSSPTQHNAFVDQETQRLSRLTAQAAAVRSEAATAAWTDRTGHAPDYLTTVGLINSSRMQAREEVLDEELYSLIEVETEPIADQEPTSTVDWGNPNRWRTLRRSEPSPAVSTLAAQVWPTRSDWFVIKAEYLLQARTEDGLELPDSPHSELALQLAQLVEDDLRRDGLPLP